MRPHQELCGLSARILERFHAVLTTSARYDSGAGRHHHVMLASLAAFYHRVPVGHVEAGCGPWTVSLPSPKKLIAALLRTWPLSFRPHPLGSRQSPERGISREAHLGHGQHGDRCVSGNACPGVASSSGHRPVRDSSLAPQTHRRDRSSAGKLRAGMTILRGLEAPGPGARGYRIVFPVIPIPTCNPSCGTCSAGSTAST